MVEISVIVPALNEEKFIEKSLKSLKSQQFDGEYEIIVADGDSEDRTIEIAKKYADRVLICPERSPGKQRNYAFQHAKGNIIAFLDSDTVADPFWLQSIKDSLSDGKTIAAIGTLLPLEKDKEYMYKVVNVIQRGLVKMKTPMFWGASCAFTRNIFEKIGGFDEKLSMAEDVDISLRARKEGKIVFNKKMVAYTSTRRIESGDGWLLYLANGINYFFFRKSAQYVPASSK